MDASPFHEGEIFVQEKVGWDQKPKRWEEQWREHYLNESSGFTLYVFQNSLRSSCVNESITKSANGASFSLGNVVVICRSQSLEYTYPNGTTTGRFCSLQSCDRSFDHNGFWRRNIHLSSSLRSINVRNFLEYLNKKIRKRFSSFHIGWTTNNKQNANKSLPCNIIKCVGKVHLFETPPYLFMSSTWSNN